MVAQQKKLENRLMPTEIIDYEIGEKFTNPLTGKYDAEVVDKGTIKKPKTSHDAVAILKDLILKYLNKGERENREYGITVCKDGRYYVVKGQKDYSRAVRCVRDPEESGIFAIIHNHPSDDDEPSTGDIGAMYESGGLMCVTARHDDIELGKADTIKCVKPIKKLLRFKDTVYELIATIVYETRKTVGNVFPAMLALSKFALPELKLAIKRDTKKEDEEKIIEEVLEGVSRYIESKKLESSEYWLNKLIMSIAVAEDVEE